MDKSYDEIKALLDDKYYLYYVDRGDDLSGKLNEVQDQIRDLESNSLWEGVFEHWWADLSYAKSELIKSMVGTFDIEEDEADALWDKHEDHLRDEIYERDASTPIDDLLRNTGDEVMYYDAEIDLYDLSSGDERVDRLKQGLRIEGDAWNRELYLMCSQAAYGGKVVIYFKGDLGDWMNHKLYTGNLITFNGCYIAVINEYNGSGDHCWFPGRVSLQFIRENLTICRTVDYSYTHKVCGMVSSWCEDTSLRVDEELLVPKLGLVEH